MVIIGNNCHQAEGHLAAINWYMLHFERSLEIHFGDPYLLGLDKMMILSEKSDVLAECLQVWWSPL